MSTGEQASSLPTAIDSLRARLEPIGQVHLLAFWDELNTEQRLQLAAQINALDVGSIPDLVSKFVHEHVAKKTNRSIEPAPCYPRDPESSDRRWDATQARADGDSLVRAGKVACFTVAGGQGSRLGYEGPKGCYPAGAVTRKPLFSDVWGVDRRESGEVRLGHSVVTS